MLSGELVDLRALGHRDAMMVWRWWNDSELMRWWGVPAPVVSEDRIERLIAHWIDMEQTLGHPVAFVIETLEHVPIGLLLLSDVQSIDRTAEIGIMIETAHRESGIGSDVLQTIVDVAFEQWGLHRLSARCEAANEPAHAFFQHNGFEFEGRLRDARFIDGRWHDILIFGCVRTDGKNDE